VTNPNDPRRVEELSAPLDSTQLRALVSIWITAIGVLWVSGVLLLVLGTARLSLGVVHVGAACIGAAVVLSIPVLRRSS
jgi:hypothetical protein